VSVSLNAQNFHSGHEGEEVRFEFRGLHQPALVEAYFESDATTLLIKFDAQPTNQAGMNGVGPCSEVLDDPTVRQLFGSPPSDASVLPPQCDWIDSSTLRVFLTMHTAAAPGMHVGIRDGVVWPSAYAYPGTCDLLSSEQPSMCARAHALTVSTDYPCDERGTPERELCIVPTAHILAPTAISSCPGSAIMLDGTSSSGGGIKPLAFEWSVYPTRSDNYYQIKPALQAAGNTPRPTLRGELDGGELFVIVLRVRNFVRALPSRSPIPNHPTTCPASLTGRAPLTPVQLGQANPMEYEATTVRDRLPIPTISIDSPPRVVMRPGSATSLQGSALLAECFASHTFRVAFRWSVLRSMVLSHAPLGTVPTELPLDERSRSLRDLDLPSSILQTGVRYTLELRGCMQIAPSICGAASVELELMNLPLVALITGGDRSVGVASTFDIDGCASEDPGVSAIPSPHSDDARFTFVPVC
jgi:hypothetical protein